MLRSERMRQATRRDRITLFLLLVLMFLAAGFGMSLAARGVHRRQFPRRQHSTHGNESEGILTVAMMDWRELLRP